MYHASYANSFIHHSTPRSQSGRIVVARACCAETDILRRNTEYGRHCEEENHILGLCLLSKPYTYEPTVSARSFLWSRNLSSQAGAKSSDGEDELEDGFSDLETHPESDKIEDVVDKEDVDVSSEGDVSELELDGTAESVLSEDETELSDEKKAARSNIASALFRTFMETPRVAINSALDKWVSEGKPLGRADISLVMLDLRRRRFYGKALQVIILS